MWVKTSTSKNEISLPKIPHSDVFLYCITQSDQGLNLSLSLSLEIVSIQFFPCNQSHVLLVLQRRCNRLSGLCHRQRNRGVMYLCIEILSRHPHLFCWRASNLLLFHPRLDMSFRLSMILRWDVFFSLRAKQSSLHFMSRIFFDKTFPSYLLLVSDLSVTSAILFNECIPFLFVSFCQRNLSSLFCHTVFLLFSHCWETWEISGVSVPLEVLYEKGTRVLLKYKERWHNRWKRNNYKSYILSCVYLTTQIHRLEI